MSATWERHAKNFENSKNQCLGKRDKSFAGRIDAKAVDICSVINARHEFYTTSSCSGRSFLYQGRGTKHLSQDEIFERCRISHDLVKDAERYFDLTTLTTDKTGGGDCARNIGQYDHRGALQEKNREAKAFESKQTAAIESQTVWLRYEPFILHVCCRSLEAASSLMQSARPAFKNVGLTSCSKIIVAIWGDEGLDMPLCTPTGVPLYNGLHAWLADLVNQRHERNWIKMSRFVQAVRDMPVVDPGSSDLLSSSDNGDSGGGLNVPKSFDVIGDVALLHSLPSGTKEEQEEIGKAIMKKNKAIKLCAARMASLEGTERCPGNLVVVAGPDRSPLVTTHTEYGIRCVVDLNDTFFSPRMGRERLRICQQVARGERVLVLFSGVGMAAMQIAGRTEASSVLAIEMNPVAVKCARLSLRMLVRNKAVKCAGAAERVEIVQGDVLEILPTLEQGSYDRVLVPRPKEGALDGDLGSGDGGRRFLELLLPVLKQEGGECHWYDFASDIELPACERTRNTIQTACNKFGYSMEVLHVASAGSVAKRQNRVCCDFRLTGRQQT